MAQLKMLISHEHRLIYVWVPKCGSSTMFQIFQALVGVPKGAEIRRVEVTDVFLSDHNAARVQVKWSKIDEFEARYPDYRWITIVRNPYARLLSAYHNKIDRFAVKIMPERCADIADKIASAREQYVDFPLLRRKLHKRISLDDMIEGLLENGTRFDAHFETQSRHLHPNRVTYDHVFKLETFDQDILEYLAKIDVPADVIARISKIPRRNRSRTIWFTKPKMNEAQRQRVFDIYRDDFSIFSYEQ